MKLIENVLYMFLFYHLNPLSSILLIISSMWSLLRHVTGSASNKSLSSLTEVVGLQRVQNDKLETAENYHLQMSEYIHENYH